MDKSSRNSSTSKIVYFDENLDVEPEVKVDSESKVLYTKVTVRLVSRIDARLEYTGQVSGKQYLWNKAGSVVEVDVEDSEILLAKHIGDKLCCGNSQDMNRIFELVF